MVGHPDQEEALSLHPKTPDADPLPRISNTDSASIADQVFDALKLRILSLALPPETKLSEADVAAQMGASRQPVREAFKRLAKLGFLVIRPQSGTRVSLISREAVLKALYIRSALEAQTCRTACETLSKDGLAALDNLITQQRSAVDAQDRALFHALDDAFHREIAVQAGVGYVWDLIHENKAHMDRVRMITLSPPSQKRALEEHVAIYEALCAGAQELAAAAMQKHLSQIIGHIEDVAAVSHDWFVEHDV